MESLKNAWQQGGPYEIELYGLGVGELDSLVLSKLDLQVAEQFVLGNQA